MSGAIMEHGEALRRVGLGLPDLLLPGKDQDLSKWAVIACDQYSSEREYWDRVANLVGDAPSTLNLILPECFLDDDNEVSERIDRIHGEMESYQEAGVLSSHKGFVLIERSLADGSTRRGLLALLDLECYDYNAGSKSLIRATEGTILERIPPRKMIRQGASMELTHIIVFIDDPADSVLGQLYDSGKPKGEKLYDFELMLGSGQIKGFGVTDPAETENVAEALHLLRQAQLDGVSGSSDSPEVPPLYAVGDGNHSLAAAKAIWEECKGGLSREEAEHHPARYASVELVNLHDSGITFDPIHRILFGSDPDAIASGVIQSLGAFTPIETEEAVASTVKAAPVGAPLIGLYGQERQGVIALRDTTTLPVAQVQTLLSQLLAKDGDLRVDYIHGAESTFRLSQNPGFLGLLLPPIGKASFFDRINSLGAFPRKSFSIGEAIDKRFYLEARRIVP